MSKEADKVKKFFFIKIAFSMKYVIIYSLSWGRYGFDRHYAIHFATHLADVKRQLNITAKNNNSYALAA